MAEIFFEQETDYLEKLDKIKDMELEWRKWPMSDG